MELQDLCLGFSTDWIFNSGSEAVEKKNKTDFQMTPCGLLSHFSDLTPMLLRVRVIFAKETREL